MNLLCCVPSPLSHRASCADLRLTQACVRGNVCAARCPLPLPLLLLQYYYDPDTGTSTYDKPAGFNSKVAAAPAIAMTSNPMAKASGGHSPSVTAAAGDIQMGDLVDVARSKNDAQRAKVLRLRQMLVGLLFGKWPWQQFYIPHFVTVKCIVLVQYNFVSRFIECSDRTEKWD